MGLTSAQDFLDWDDSPPTNGNGSGNGGDDGAHCPTCGQKVPRLSDPTAKGFKLHTDAHDTERKAAARVYPNSGNQRHTVLMALARRGPCLDEDLVEMTGFKWNSLRPRRVELVDGGWVYDTGERRLNENGNESAVWALTGRAALAVREREGFEPKQ